MSSLAQMSVLRPMLLQGASFLREPIVTSLPSSLSPSKLTDSVPDQGDLSKTVPHYLRSILSFINTKLFLASGSTMFAACISKGSTFGQHDFLQ